MEYYGTFNHDQVQQLLKPLNPSRVEKRRQGGMELSYLTQADVRAHLARVFGFGGFDVRLIRVEILSCEQPDGGRNWDVSALAHVELTVRNPDGMIACVYSDAAVGSGHLPNKGEALDFAVKTAESDALKRAAINLGDQFGLGLYDNGSTAAYVRGTMVMPPDFSKPDEPDDDAVEAAAIRALQERAGAEQL